MKKLISFVTRFIPRKYLQRVGGLGIRITGVFYMGKGVVCPICESEYRKFLPYGRLSTRENALCPHCLSLERHRLIWKYLSERSSFFDAGRRILHVAPEACFIPRLEKIHGENYVTADIESPLAKVKMDIHEMPFEDNSFDFVICNHVLEHVRDDIQAMREIRRVLKPGGMAILQVPFFKPIPEVTFEDNSITDPRERERVFGQDDHVRKYGHDYLHRIERAGLIATADPYAGQLPAEVQHRFGLAWSEIIYKASKPA